MIALLLAPLTGCFTPAADPLVFDKLPFENAYTLTSDIVMVPFSYDDFNCPDGDPATFFAVYREGITEAAPIVIVFHAGAFDYTVDPNPEDPLAGPHYAGDDKLSSEWASNKVLETFGLIPGSEDSFEQNLGTLPAALADKGTFALYPANCWGDMWHNEDGYAPNDWDADGGIHRQGRALAWAMTRFASKDAEEATEWRTRFGLDALPIPLDASGIHMVGLGEGGRAPAELLRRIDDASDANFPQVNGVIVDSAMDDLYPVAAGTGFENLNAGLMRLFPNDFAGDIGHYSLGRWIPEEGLDFNLQVFWSSGDPMVPDETLSTLIDLESSYDAEMEVRDELDAIHVVLNRDATLARDAVEFMLTPQ